MVSAIRALRSVSLPLGALEVAALALLAFAAASGLGYPLLDVNEGIYARIAVEMAHGGSWIVPTLDGVPYLEKPPLVYWITAIAFKAFGVHEQSARVASLASVLLLVSAAWWVARRELGPRIALACAAMLASFPAVLVLGRTLTLDALFAGLLAWSLVALFEGLQRRERRWMIASFALLALAVLTKGLAAVAFYGLVAAALVTAEGKWRDGARFLLAPIPILVALAIAVPWHVAATVEQPGFAWFYFVNEHLMRFVDQRIPHDYHTGPWWFYLRSLTFQAFPWIALLALSPRARGAWRRPVAVFAWAWFLVPLAIFSLSSAKGEHFLLVAMPALALILASRLAALEGRAEPAVLALALLGMIAFALSMPEWAWSPYQVPASVPLLLALSGAAACISALFFFKRETVVAVGILAAAALPLGYGFASFLASNAELKSERALMATLRAGGIERVLLYRDFEKMSSIAFYDPRPIAIIDSDSDDLWYGSVLEPDAPIFLADSPSVVDSSQRLAVLVHEDRLDDFMDSEVAEKLRWAGRVGRVLIFTPRSGAK